MPGYDYFAGSSVIVEVANMPILECVGIQIEEGESKRPFYGYSSRYFDFIGQGQSIVHGQVAINYVHSDYLYHAVRLGQDTITEDTKELVISDEVSSELFQLAAQGKVSAEAFGFLEERIWGVAEKEVVTNNIDNITIKITFGERSPSNSYNGETGYILEGVHFTGSGQGIQIDENVILETYSFIARRKITLR